MPCSVGRNVHKYKGTLAASTLQDVTDNGNTTSLSIQTDGFFIGDGSLITNLPGALGYGTLEQVTTTGNSTSHEVSFENTITSLRTLGNVVVTGNVTALTFQGDGANLTGVVSTTDFGNNVLRLETNLVANSDRITAVVGDLGSNAIRIENLETNLVANSDRITAVVGDLGSNAIRIENLETNLVANSDRITAVVSNLVANSDRITAVVGDLGSNVIRIENLNTRLVANSVRIQDLETSTIVSNSSSLNGFTQGDILYASAANTLTSLSIGSTGVGNVLTVTGPGNIAWQPPTGGGGTGNVGTLQDVTTNGPSTSTEVSFTNLSTSFRASGNVVISGNVTAQVYHGDGSNLGGILTFDNVTRIENLESNLVSNSDRITEVANNLESNVITIGNLPIISNTSSLTGVSIGDILYASNNNQITTLSPGATGEVLTVDGATGLPTWKNTFDNIVENTTSTGIGIPPGVAPTHTLEVGSNVVVDDIGSDVLYVRGNVYTSKNITILDTTFTNRIVCQKILVKNSEVVAERPTRIIRII